MLDGVKAGAFGEHPAREDALHLPRQLHLIDFDEARRLRRFRGRAAVADARRDFQRSELNGLIDGNLQVRDAARHLIERGEDGDRILDRLGARGCGWKREGAQEREHGET
jgi:hypothetical protein